jgi:catechol 2,3-dioxygenase-like lactoylglutathione lyase family enzyme
MICSVHHAQIIIPVGKEDEAREFYCRLLGLTEIQKPDALRSRGGLWLEIEGFQVHLGVEDAAGQKLSKAHVAYLVEGLEHWRARLIESDIEILDGIPIPNYSRFEFRDPFGNRVEFLEQIEHD